MKVSNEGMKALVEFVKYVGENKEAAEKVKDFSNDAQAIMSYAKGLGYSFEEKDIQEYGRKVLLQTEELSDHDLEKVAGGLFTPLAGVTIQPYTLDTPPMNPPLV